MIDFFKGKKGKDQKEDRPLKIVPKEEEPPVIRSTPTGNTLEKIDEPAKEPNKNLPAETFDFDEVGAQNFTGQIRKGMWVYANGLDRIGIVASFIGRGFAELHLVNELGETALVTQANTSTLRQARFSEIPDIRKPDQASAARFGYFN